MTLPISRRGMHFLPEASHIIELYIHCALPKAHFPILEFSLMDTVKD